MVFKATAPCRLVDSFYLVDFHSTNGRTKNPAVFITENMSKMKDACHLNQNKDIIKLYQATGTNRWDRPPLPQKYNEQGRNHVGTALDFAR